MAIRLMSVCLLATLARADPLDDALQSQAAEIRSQSPMMVDKSTRLDSVVYADRLFSYHYSQLAHPSTDYSTAAKARYAVQLREQVIGRACALAQRRFIEAGVTFRYVHFASDNQLIAAVSVTKSDCTSISNTDPQPSLRPDVA